MSKQTRRGFFGTVAAVGVGAVAAIHAKPAASVAAQQAGSGRLLTGSMVGADNTLNPDWEAWFKAVAEASKAATIEIMQ